MSIPNNHPVKKMEIFLDTVKAISQFKKRPAAIQHSLEYLS